MFGGLSICATVVCSGLCPPLGRDLQASSHPSSPSPTAAIGMSTLRLVLCDVFGNVSSTEGARLMIIEHSRREVD